MPEALSAKCSRCGEFTPSWFLVTCPICGTATCQKCATAAYGRAFCSPSCAEYFFHGESDDEEDERG